MTAIYGAAGTDGRQLAWPLLDEAVRLYWGWPSLPPVDRSPRGKPLFRGREDRWFSLSHSGGLALCALSAAIYYVRGQLDVGLALPYLLGGLIGGFVGGRVFKNLSMTWLRRGFALLILYGGVRAFL